MKKDGSSLLVIIFCSLCLVLGIFIGRNLNEEYVMLEENGNIAIETLVSDAESYRLDINSATQSQLQELPGIGEVIAGRIVEYREINGPFQRVDDLRNVEGIGEKKLDAIIELVTVGG